MNSNKARFVLGVVALAVLSLGAWCDVKPSIPEHCKGITDPAELLKCINGGSLPFTPRPSSPPTESPTVHPSPSVQPPETPTTADTCERPPIWKVNGGAGCAAWLPNKFDGKPACGLDATIWMACSKDGTPTMGDPRVPVAADGTNYAPVCDGGHMNGSTVMQKCCSGVQWSEFEDPRGIVYTVSGPCVDRVIAPWGSNNWDALVVFKKGCPDRHVTSRVCPPTNPIDTKCHLPFRVIGTGCKEETFIAKIRK